jgi:hypothetical protein
MGVPPEILLRPYPDETLAAITALLLPFKIS